MATMKSVFLAVPLASVIIVAPALAEDWVGVGRSGTATITYDRDSKTVANGRVTYWDRIISPSPHPIGIYEDAPMTGSNVKGTTQFVEMRTFHDVDCKARTDTRTLIRFYDDKGVVVSRVSQTIGPAPIPSNTAGEIEAKALCPTQ